MGDKISKIFNAIPVNISFQNHDLLKKAACLFAGMNHMQPLLLATTNSHYLLDRFCMERCCSGEYISRIVTSLIFMEVMATLLVACLGVGIACTNSTEWQGATGLNKWNQNEEWWRGIVGSAIQLIIFLGYFQIFLAFVTGGKKGHVHWFYVSLMFQQFVCLLIGGAIGFWEAGITLWYLMAIPMGPIPVFFYQLMIHSWIRNNGPRYPEYIIVEWQIGLALCISILATLFWIYAYCQPYIPIELEITNLTSSGTPSTTDAGRIATGTAKTLALKTGQNATGTAPDLTRIGLANVKADVTLTACSLTLVTIKDNNYAILTLEAKLTIQFTPEPAGGSVTVTSATKGTGPPIIILNTTASSKPNIKVNSVHPVVNVNKKTDNKTVNISLAVEEIRVTLDSSNADIKSVKVTIPVNIKVAVQSEPIPINSVKLNLNSVPAGTGVTDRKLTIENPHYDNSGTKTLEITAQTATGNDGTNAVQATGTVFYPNNPGHCIYSVRDTSKDIWANIGGKCFFAACYKNDTPNKALLVLYLRNGDTLNMKYYGKKSTEWYEFESEAEFHDKLGTNISALATNGQLSGLGNKTTQYNRVFDNIRKSPVWLPLLMHGMAVGSFGSIFPNLIPKTLVCARTSRNLSVVSIFLSPVPHIINLALAENDLLSSIGVGDDWTKNWRLIWPCSLLLYIIYILAFLFAIFNVHSPEWKLCCYIRSHGWMPFMMTLSITLIIEILIAIARAGIMMQKPAGGKDKNHPLLWNKIACLLSLSYLPFWMTTTPMMKSYVSSLDPFLCDKDRDHWPTARYGAWRSGWYWCKCGLRGLYNTPRKLITLNMRKALTRKDPPLFYTLYGLLRMIVMEKW